MGGIRSQRRSDKEHCFLAAAAVLSLIEIVYNYSFCWCLHVCVSYVKRKLTKVSDYMSSSQPNLLVIQEDPLP